MTYVGVKHCLDEKRNSNHSKWFEVVGSALKKNDESNFICRKDYGPVFYGMPKLLFYPS